MFNNKYFIFFLLLLSFDMKMNCIPTRIVSPMIWVPNQLVGAPAGTDVTIDCNTEAHPKYIKNTFYKLQFYNINFLFSLVLSFILRCV